jgi:hypothetical protein
MKLKSIFEANSTETKTKTGIDALDDLLWTSDSTVHAPAASPKQSPTAPKSKTQRTVPSRSNTARKMGGVVMPSGAPKIHRDQIDTSGEISDEQAMRNAGYSHDDETEGREPIPTTPENLPAVIKHSMELSTGSNVDVDWHMVKHLPGYMSSAIRAMGRQVFAPFTNTAIEDIQVVANLQDSGPNSDEEVDAISKYVSANGQANSAAELYFREAIPGYSAQIVSYDADGYTFVLVKDFAGKYIYSWPAKDSKKAFTRGVNADRAQLGN